MLLKLRYLYRAYRYRYRVDPAELRFLCTRLQAGQVAVDIGCHKGAYTYWMRRRVGPGGAVFAFEPQPTQVAYLRRAFSTMNYDNVVLMPMAVSNRIGTLPLHLSPASTHGASLEATHEEQELQNERANAEIDRSSATIVDVITLDAFFADKQRGPNFLKIDVEGHESAVLEGARETLGRYRPAVLLECEARHRPDGDVRSVFEFFQSHGYEASFFCHGDRRPLSEFDAAVHQHIGPDAKHLPRGYVNNFAFEPRA